MRLTLERFLPLEYSLSNPFRFSFVPFCHAQYGSAKYISDFSVFSISAEEKEVGTELRVALLQPCGGLSEQGKERTMAAMSDRIVQYLENELLMNRPVERLNHEPENGSGKRLCQINKIIREEYCYGVSG